MVDREIEDLVERLAREHVGTAPTLRCDGTWLHVTRTGTGRPADGWKLHVSSRVVAFPDLVEKLVPELLGEGCDFKLAQSAEVLGRLNDGISSPASVGKAFTVYADQDRIRDLGLRLAALLRGHEGPRILSDRRIAADAPVYYRYGPFTLPWRTDSQGRLLTLIDGPAGQEFGALATLRYRQPEWTVDPFTGAAGDEPERRDHAEDQILGTHFRVNAGVFETGRGNVVRAVDLRDGTRVVVKQGRALVDEGESGDVRLRLRNERRILQALDGFPGIPRFVDHFRHGADEYLVTTDVGRRNLDEDAMADGRYAPAAELAEGDDRSLERLGGRIARIVLGLHDRGVVIRDLSPKNVIVDGDRVSLIDFGIAWYDGLHLPGGTYGYSPARQWRKEPPRPSDDLFALGMTLVFAAHVLTPVTVGEDTEEPRLRALQLLRSRYGETPCGIMGLIADLIGADGGDHADQERSADAARRLAAGDVDSRRTSGTRLPAPPEPTPGLLADITGNLLADLVDQTRRVLTAPSSRSVAHDASVYSGSAGIGLELLEHLGEPGVREVLDELTPFTVRAMTRVGLPPGLLVGRTGVDVFLRQSLARGIDAGDTYTGAVIPGPDWKPEGDDLIVGAAGIGLGHLLLHDLAPDPGHLEIARRCGESVMEHPPLDSDTVFTTLPEGAAVEPSSGRAHGLAGTVEALVLIGSRLGDDAMVRVGAERADVLVDRARRLVERSHLPSAAPLAASWCQGLAGIARSLLHAGDVLDDPALLTAARQAADACVAFLPRVSVASQCCGAAGIGNTLIDFALHDADQRYWDAATAVAAEMLLRGSGPAGHPVFKRDAPEDNSASWAFGVAGTLAFFRRLSHRGGATGLPLPIR